MTGQNFVAVGNTEAPRWLLPLHEPGIHEALRGWQPQTWSNRVMWGGVRAAVRCGKLQLLPRLRRVDLKWLAEFDWCQLGWSPRHAPIPVVHMGTAGPARKAIVHLVNRETERCELIVKVPLTDAAASAILREAEVLDALRHLVFPIVPSVLKIDRNRGISSQSVVPGKPDCKSLGPQHWSALNALKLPERTSLREHARRLNQEIELHGNNVDAHTLRAACMQMSDNTRLQACWVHGDFAPWNIRQQPDGSIALLDWEDAHRGGLPLHDAYHYLHIQRYLWNGRPGTASRELSPSAEALGVCSRLSRQLEIAYLASTYLLQVQRRNQAFTPYLLRALRIAANT